MEVVLDEFSMSPPTVNAHRLHNNATMIELMSQLAAVYVSYAFVVAAVGLLKRNHCQEYPECV